MQHSKLYLLHFEKQPVQCTQRLTRLGENGPNQEVLSICMAFIYLDGSKSVVTRIHPERPVRNSVYFVRITLMTSTSGYVFPSPKTGGRMIDLKTSFRAAVDAAKIRDFRFHDLRHTAATRMADAGANVIVIAEILGHGDIRTTKRYSHTMDESNREAVEKLTNTGASRQKPVKKQKRQAAGLAVRSKK